MLRTSAPERGELEARGIHLDAFRAIHLKRMNPLPGRGKLLQSLTTAGIYLGVVSNKTGGLLRREVEALGWSALFGGVVGAGDAALDKPDARRTRPPIPVP